MASLKDRVVKKFLSLNLLETGWIQSDNLDEAKLVLKKDNKTVEVENEHGTNYPILDLSTAELKAFEYLLKTTPPRQLKPIYKTIIQVEVLSEDKYGETDLRGIYADIIGGGCSGIVNIKSSKQLLGKKAVDAIEKQGSSPDFFLMDEKGFESEY